MIRLEYQIRNQSRGTNMDCSNLITSLRTNKHLNLEERFYLEKRLLAGDPINTIAKALGRSRTTIYAEKKRGTVVQIKQNKAVLMYVADCGQLAYERTHQGSFNTLKAGSIEPFLSWVETKVRIDKWSLDAVGYALRKGLFVRNEMVCTKTLYNYLHQGILGLKPMDLPCVIRHSHKKRHNRQHKRKLGKSIDLRDESVATREEFGHWELDTVRGIKNKSDEVIVSLLERKSRLYVALRCLSAKAVDVKMTLENWLQSLKAVSNVSMLCKTITADNGREFADISTLETEDLSIFFAHPYSPGERGSNERHNGLLRRFIPKGTPIKAVSEETIQRALNWCNNLPRKLLDYQTPQEVFIKEVNKVMDLQSVQFYIAI